LLKSGLITSLCALHLAMFWCSAPMALIKTCNFCGAKISLRKMPHGRYVAFDYRSQSPHKCESKKKTKRNSASKTARTESRKKTPARHQQIPTSTGVPRTSIPQPSISKNYEAIVARVFEAIKQQPGLKAREIAEQLGFDRNQVNAILYGPLNELVEQDSHFGWQLKQGQSFGVPEQVPSQRFKADQGNEINGLKWIGYAVGAFILYKILTG